MAASPPIYFYDVPPCAREVPFHLVAQVEDGEAGAEALRPAERLHLRGMLQHMLAVERHLEREHRVSSPEEASLFYVPAYFPLLFWLDQRVTDPEHAPHLACVKETLARMSELPFLLRNAGYDHLLLYGYEYPHWKRLNHLVLDTYSPFMGNALLLSVSFWSQGRRAALFGGGLYPLLRVIPLPYYAAWDCSHQAELLTSPRDIVVSFVGSLKNNPPHFVFRERLYLSAAVERPELANDSRVFVQLFPSDDERRHAFARDFIADRASLYTRSHFCLVMPGDGNTAGRVFDVMVSGCVPVLFFHPDTYPVLPFSTKIPWADITLAHSVANEDDVAVALARVLAVPAAEREEYRRRTIEHAPLVALALNSCPPSARSALSLISEELSDRTRLLFGTLFPGVRVMPPPTNASDWLRWGPAGTPSDAFVK